MPHSSASRPSPLPKARYRVTNWRDYNRALVGRGSITLRRDEDLLAGWQAVGAKGRRYSDVAILAALSLRTFFRLPLRAAQGFLTSLKTLLGLTIRVPHYSTLSRRAEGLAVPQPTRCAQKGPVHLAIDSKVLRVFGEGEWKVRLHGKDKRRIWRKLHLAVDTTTGEIAAHVLTESGCHDGPELPGLLALVEGPLEAVYGDKAYNSFASHTAFLARKGASITPPPELKDPPASRGDAVRRIA